MQEGVKFINKYALTEYNPDYNLDVGDIVLHKRFWQAFLKERGLEK